jgi:putative restriction endonuclease
MPSEPRGLPKRTLLDRVLAGPRVAGWNVLFLSETHPFDLVLSGGDRRLQIRVYVWNVTHGGATRSADEYRIQVTGVDLPISAPKGFKTMLLGWYEPLGVVAAFDPRHHRRPSAASPSIQISLKTLKKAASRGLGIQSRAAHELALAFRPSMLIPYIEEQDVLHSFAGKEREIRLLERAGSGHKVSAPQIRQLPFRRRQVIRTVVSKWRDSAFRDRVLDAYEHQCAVCRIQLDLIEAAHIVPVDVAGSTDYTDNGIALCALHHKAYDAGIIRIDASYRVTINRSRLNRLRAIGHAAGAKMFRKQLRPMIFLPAKPADLPEPDHLRRGLTLRGKS